MHSSKSTRSTTDSKGDAAIALAQRLAETKRLSADEKSTFAKNLGALAVRLSPADPIDGARRIVMHAGNQSLWPTKRKKFFRFPEEDAPPGGKNGEYASNPAQFRKLAEAAGELLCNDRRPEAVEASRRSCLKSLVKGTRFMPTYIPTDGSDQSAKALLDDYAAALVEAIKTRTRLLELWDITKHTPISLRVYSDAEVKEIEPSPYGEAASFPSELLQPSYRSFISCGHLEASPDGYDGSWSFPNLLIGAVAFVRPIMMFSIPPEKANLFPPSAAARRQISDAALEWMKSVGFDRESSAFPPLEFNRETDGWTKVKAAVLKQVSLDVYDNEENGIAVGIQLLGDGLYVVEAPADVSPGFLEKVTASADGKLRQHFECAFEGWDFVDLVYNKPIDPSNTTDAQAIGILPSGWQWESYDFTPEIKFVRIDDDDWAEIWSWEHASGWTEDEQTAQLLLGDVGTFVPVIPDSEPRASILRAGSIGASLMQNARAAEGANRISQRLIDRAALLADTGLRFYEALVEDYRAAIQRI